MPGTLTLDRFAATLADPAPPGNLAAPLAALWWAGRGDWDRAHARAQDEAGRDAAWVHAHLHRREGDETNARYWYARAGRPAATGALDEEWRAMAAALLAGPSSAERRGTAR